MPKVLGGIGAVIDCFFFLFSRIFFFFRGHSKERFIEELRFLLTATTSGVTAKDE